MSSAVSKYVYGSPMVKRPNLVLENVKVGHIRLKFAILESTGF